MGGSGKLGAGDRGTWYEFARCCRRCSLLPYIGRGRPSDELQGSTAWTDRNSLPGSRDLSSSAACCPALPFCTCCDGYRASIEVGIGAIICLTGGSIPSDTLRQRASPCVQVVP